MKGILVALTCTAFYSPCHFSDLSLGGQLSLEGRDRVSDFLWSQVRRASLLCLKEGMKSTATHSPSKSEAKGHTEGSITPRHGQFLQQSCRLANPLPRQAPPDRLPRREFLSPRPLKTVIFCKQLRLLKQCFVSHLPVELQHPPGSWEGQWAI